MKHLAFSGNNIINARLPDSSAVYHAPEALPGLPPDAYPERVREAVERPLESPPLRELVNSDSKVLIAFDDNSQPFPATARPDFRQVTIETLLALLDDYGVRRENIHLICAVALHRKMKPPELERMVGPAVMREFFPERLTNFDAEDRDNLVELGETEHEEPVEISRLAAEADLVIYVDAVQIPLNGGHKAVGVGLASYRTIACHHTPSATAETAHVMQPDGSRMHESIDRIGRIVDEHCKIFMLCFAMNGATYPPHMSWLGKPPERCNAAERLLRAATPLSMKLLPEAARRGVLRGLAGAYRPIEINAGSVEAVHQRTMAAMRRQMRVEVPRQYDTLVYGLPDLSPYAVDASVNPVLVVSDVLGYVFNWFYNKPLVRRGGSVIILNPVDEVFHPEYHVAYRRFYEEALAETTDPFELQQHFQRRFAEDPELIDAYRNRWAHHGFHPFTVWYWATYPLKYLSRVILVGPKGDSSAKRLGVQWAPSLDAALEMSRRGGQDHVAALTIPPMFYVDVGPELAKLS